MFTIEELLAATAGKLISRKRPGKTGVLGISIDSRTLRENEAFIAIKGDNFNGHDFIRSAVKKGAGCVICEQRYMDRPGNTAWLARSVPCAVIAVRDTTRALGDIASFHRSRFDIPVIAITGSNGKTTTKEMLAWILAERFNVLKTAGTKNNHIGLPMTLLGLKAGHQACVLELGTSDFGEISYLSKICRPNIGIITNIGPSHLEYFKDLNGVLQEKYSLMGHLRSPAVAVVNADDRLLRVKSRSAGLRPFIVSFGIDKPADFSALMIKKRQGSLEFKSGKKYKFILHTLGYNNIYNALAAISAARIMGVPYKDISRRLSAFEFPKGRLRLIRAKECVFIDDTYNSSPASLRQAALALGDFKARGRKIFVMGDMLELGEMKEACHYQAGIEAARSCDKFIAVGKLTAAAAAAARNSGLADADIFQCDRSVQARDILRKDLRVGADDVVLVKGSRAMKMEDVFFGVDR
ncbi:MAG: UDP-N-acetylmuramoyl-tripeptide--D-alanyl-D-alanine ligase [Candidatus Omnitrophica bacterium]|nr:UDP-N-acetylmuramoyl-tripeptide--D-alanyl-D-alanine ligase [Candidatus Omnitrophota bacterium]